MKRQYKDCGWRTGPFDLKAFMDAYGIMESARILGTTPHRLQRMVAGKSPIPAMVGMACSAVVAGLDEFAAEDLGGDEPEASDPEGSWRVSWTDTRGESHEVVIAGFGPVSVARVQ